jgi:hypothetical protein
VVSKDEKPFLGPTSEKVNPTYGVDSPGGL